MKQEAVSNLYNPRFLRLSIFMYFLLIPIFFILDPQQLVGVEKKIYISGRLITLFLYLAIFLDSFKSQKSWHLIGTYVGLLAHGIFGQFFLAPYFLSYMEIIMPIALFLPLKTDRQFYSITTVAFIAMIVAIFLGKSYSTDPKITDRFHLDATCGIIISTVLAILGYHFVTRVRKEKDFLSAKFLDIGQNASSMIHDFKGLLTTPMMYSEMLNSQKMTYDKKTQDIISFLNDDLKILREFVFKTNLLNNLQETKGLFELNEVIDSLKIILKSYIKGSEVEILANPQLNFYKNLLLKVLYNLFINALEAKGEQKNFKITVNFDKKEHALLVMDNGSGFNANTLKRINSGQLAESTSANGSSIGTYMVKELIASKGGKVIFSNNENGIGACVKIYFPRK